MSEAAPKALSASRRLLACQCIIRHQTPSNDASFCILWQFWDMFKLPFLAKSSVLSFHIFHWLNSSPNPACKNWVRFFQHLQSLLDGYLLMPAMTDWPLIATSRSESRYTIHLRPSIAVGLKTWLWDAMSKQVKRDFPRAGAFWVCKSAFVSVSLARFLAF